MFQINPLDRTDPQALRNIMRNAARSKDCKLLHEAVYWLIHLLERPEVEDERLIKASGCSTWMQRDLSLWFLHCYGRSLSNGLMHGAFQAGMPEFIDVLFDWTEMFNLPFGGSTTHLCSWYRPGRGDHSEEGYQPEWDGFRWAIYSKASKDMIYLGDSPDPRFHLHSQILHGGEREREAQAFVFWNGFRWVVCVQEPGRNKSHLGFWNTDTQSYEPVNLPPPPDGYYFTDRGFWNPDKKEFEPVVRMIGDGGVTPTSTAPLALPTQQGLPWWLYVGGAAALAGIAAITLWRRR